MVTKVSENDVSTKDRATGQSGSIPYGLVVWSTGIAPRPFILDFMKQIGQGNRRVLATDEWLRVEGCDSVYALGDCATINQRKVMVIQLKCISISMVTYLCSLNLLIMSVCLDLTIDSGGYISHFRAGEKG